MKDCNLPSGRSTGGPSAEDDKGIRKKKWNSPVIAIDIKCYNVAKAARQLHKLKHYKKFTQQNYKSSTLPVVTKTRGHIEDLRPPCKEDTSCISQREQRDHSNSFKQRASRSAKAFVYWSDPVMWPGFQLNNNSWMQYFIYDTLN